MNYDDLIANAPVGICFAKGRKLIRCNRRFEEIFGYNEEELTHQTLHRLFATGQVLDCIGGHRRRYGFEQTGVRKDGSTVWCLVAGNPVDPARPRSGRIWVVQDITSHKRTEIRLREGIEKLELTVERQRTELQRCIAALDNEVASRKKAVDAVGDREQKLAALFRVLPVAIAVTDPDGRIIETSRAFRDTFGTGAAPATWGGLQGRFYHPDGTLIPRTSLPRTIQATQGEAAASLEIGTRTRRGGRLNWMHVNSAPLNLSGRPAMLTAFIDVTNRKRAEALERLRHAVLTRLARIDSLSGTSMALVHQLGQPLVSALNYLNGCRMRLGDRGDTDGISGSIALAIGCLEQAGDILRRVDNFVRHHEPERSPEDINLLIHDAVSFLAGDMDENGITVKFDCVAGIPPVPLCKIEIQQVLFNLLKNAIQSMIGLPDGERTLVVGSLVMPDGAEVAVFVTDTGRGIRRNQSNRVFEALYTTKPDGVGIGLTICRYIVESHGGRLSFVRTGRRGSRFQFTLPMVSVADAREAPRR
jgi:PAS domain S-box-containing protein